MYIDPFPPPLLLTATFQIRKKKLYSLSNDANGLFKLRWKGNPVVKYLSMQLKTEVDRKVATAILIFGRFR